ncbi:hypothetical protein [Micromonospora sp. KC213]|uniref:hypothetical protein n=1 Tax=Micromonospora sp. KC213 TaxID=2530378 RepID=UPI001A9D29CF|nr:hypothetical protein [Micromonospora sp. KC213]
MGTRVTDIHHPERFPARSRTRQVHRLGHAYTVVQRGLSITWKPSDAGWTFRLIIDVALQTQALLNRARLFALSHAARSRLNTALATGNFIGGAIGSAAATTLWSAGGWTAVTITGTTLCCFALTVWTLGRRGPLVIASP